MPFIHRAARLLLAASAFALAPTLALAQAEWPAAKTITYVVPFTAGGSTDIVGRILANKLQESLHQSVVVDNKPGQAGGIGAAVRWAEAAVELRPQVADYRAVLGQAYLLAGRFASAHTTFNDALTLSPGDGKVALNMALAQIAEGDWTGARQTLDSNSGSIPVSDRGLAMALAGGRDALRGARGGAADLDPGGWNRSSVNRT